MITIQFRPTTIEEAFKLKNLIWEQLKQDQTIYIDFCNEVYIDECFWHIFMQLYLHFDRDYIAKKLIPINLTPLLKEHLKVLRDQELKEILSYLEVVNGVKKQKRSKKSMYNQNLLVGKN